MATIILQAYHAESSRDRPGAFAVIFHLTGKAPPLPQKRLEVKNTAEAMAALEDYKKEAAATGLPTAVTIKAVGRAPNGFKKAQSPYYHGVNV